MKEIRRYSGKMGDITVTFYDKEDGGEVYLVKHSGLPEGTSWHRDKSKAIAAAQFLAGKY